MQPSMSSVNDCSHTQTLLLFIIQYSTWEKGSYNSTWKDLSLLDWVNDGNIDNNHYVKKLAGKRQNKDIATEEDLELAKRAIQSYFVVGLLDHMEEIIKRFNVVLGLMIRVIKNLPNV